MWGKLQKLASKISDKIYFFLTFMSKYPIEHIRPIYRIFGQKPSKTPYKIRIFKTAFLQFLERSNKCIKI